MLRTRALGSHGGSVEGKPRGAVYPSVGRTRALIVDTPRNRWQRARILHEKFARVYISLLVRGAINILRQS